MRESLFILTQQELDVCGFLSRNWPKIQNLPPAADKSCSSDSPQTRHGTHTVTHGETRLPEVESSYGLPDEHHTHLWISSIVCGLQPVHRHTNGTRTPQDVSIRYIYITSGLQTTGFLRAEPCWSLMTNLCQEAERYSALYSVYLYSLYMFYQPLSMFDRCRCIDNKADLTFNFDFFPQFHHHRLSRLKARFPVFSPAAKGSRIWHAGTLCLYFK